MLRHSAKIIFATAGVVGVLGAGVAVASDPVTCPYGNTPKVTQTQTATAPRRSSGCASATAPARGTRSAHSSAARARPAGTTAATRAPATARETPPATPIARTAASEPPVRPGRCLPLQGGHLAAGGSQDRVMAPLVLIVEDELKIRELIRRYLERDGMRVLTTGSGAEAITLAADAGPDLVVLDLGLPDVPGEEVARELRAASDVPIVMLTARSDERDRIAGLELGADDYVSKPFSPRELVLRVQAVLRRGGGPAPASRTGPVSFGGGQLRIDEDRREVVVRGAPVELTPTEWGLLSALARTPGRVSSRYELINEVRGYEFEGYERTVDSHVKNLRRKIEADPQQPLIVRTVLGAGYRLGLKRDA